MDMDLLTTVADTSGLKSIRNCILRYKIKYVFWFPVFAAAVCFIIAAASFVSYAVPALETPRVLSQPSGEKFTATLHGDEWFNFTAATDGTLVVKGSDGYLYYGIAAHNGLAKSSAKYKIDARPSNAQTVKDVKNLRNKKYADFEKTHGIPVPIRSSGFSESANTSSGSPDASAMALSGTQKVLVLLVSFKDVGIVNTDSAWSNEFFGDSGKTLKTFYKEMSANNFYFSPALETKGTANDGVIRVTLTYNHPNTGEDINSKNQKIVIDAVTAADPYINYSIYDTNADSIITASELHILTVVAGNDCSYGDPAPCIWPHSWTTDDYIYKDGKYIYGDYTQIAEKQGGHMTTMGVVAHELGHDIGLPDLYDTDYSSDGLGVYSLMSSGSWGMAYGEYAGASPTHMDAWCKIQLGFVTPLTVSSGSYNMNSAANGGYNVVKVTTSDPNQYFLVENRQATGFDAGMYYYGISTGGIAIYHVDNSVTTDNDNETHKLVDLEEANEVAYGGSQLDDDNSRGLAYNNLFRTGTNTLFSAATTPGSALYGGAATNISVSIPGGYSGVMTVLINYSSITFSSNGGTAVATITQPAGTVIQKPADPVKTGYTFGGWYYNSGLTTPVTWPYTFGMTNVVFYARWTANSYTVTYNGNGSSGGATADSAHTYDIARNLTVNGFTRSGYSFLGWSEISGAITANYTNGQSVINLTANPGAIITFYAVWAVNYYSITFNANGGTGSTGPDSMAYGSALCAPVVAREGYTFTGWNPAVPSTVPPMDTIYTAQWSVNHYTVSFDEAGGSEVSDVTLDYGMVVTTPADPERTGYTFAGWVPAVPETMPAEDTLCVAQWTANTYTITFNANGGTGGAVEPLIFDDPLTAPSVSKTGYTFTGWNPEVPETVPAEDTQYTAQWKANVYTVVYNGNGATGGATASSSHIYDEPKTLTINGFYRTGYTFAGWQLSDCKAPGGYSDGEIVVNLSEVNDAVVTLYASWNVNQYTVSFDETGGTEVSDITQDYGTPVAALAEPSRTGYTFAGWQPAIPETMPAENTICIAQWMICQYTVTYWANGDIYRTLSLNFGDPIPHDPSLLMPEMAPPAKTGYTLAMWSVPAPNMPAHDITVEAVFTINTYNAVFYVDSVLYESVPTLYNTVIAVPENPAKTGHTFAGWDPVPGTIGAGDEAFNAVFAVNKYTIEFEANGGEGGTGPALLTFGETLTAPEVTRNGYTFTGWEPEAPATVPAADTVYTAQWQINSYRYTFDANGGEGSASGSLDYGEPLAAPAVEREGYTFAGWEPEVPAFMPAQDQYFTAQWSIITHTVTFDLNGGEGSVPPPQNGAPGTAVELPGQGDLSRLHHTFAGWAETPDAITAISTCTVGQADSVLYAVWVDIEVRLTARAGATTVVNEQKAFIYGLTPGISRQVLADEYILVLGDGRLEFSRDIIGTGTEVTLISNITNEAVAVYTVVIYGDLNGDGNIDSGDAGKIIDYENFRFSWNMNSDAAYLQAGDLNGDGNIDSGDAGITVDSENFFISIDQITGLANPI